MKRLLLVVFFFLFYFLAVAQQIGMYNHYFYKPMVYNPAYAGSGEGMDVFLLRRVQWTGFDGGPRLSMFSLDGNARQKKLGFGLSVINDKKGINNKLSGNLLYSYKVAFQEDLHIAFGISLGFVNQSQDFSKVVLENNTDPGLYSDKLNQTVADGNAGFVLSWKKFELGAAIPQIFGSSLQPASSGSYGFSPQVRHYLSSLKYKFSLAQEKSISVVPQGLIRIVPNTPVQFEGNVNVEWNQKIWGGFTYKSNYALAANIGLCAYKNLYLGYSYDFILGNIAQYAGMSHEVMLNYRFGTNKKETPKAVMEKTIEPAVKEQKPQKDEKDLVPELNALIIHKLLKDIEALLDKPKAASTEVNELVNRIHSFMDSDFGDTSIYNTMKRQYEILLHSSANPFIAVKGILVLKTDGSVQDFSGFKISLLNSETNKLIGVYTPNPVSGKYLLVLNPGHHYLIEVQGKGYRTYSGSMSIQDSKESYEIDQKIFLQKQDF
jgi:type IX secretion system PorP/SprF family membrane protein